MTAHDTARDRANESARAMLRHRPEAAYRPTTAQRALLRDLLRGGDRVSRVPRRTKDALINAGLITYAPPGGWHLTDAGRALIERIDARADR